MRIRRFAKVLAAFLAGVMLVQVLYACSPRGLRLATPTQAGEKTRLMIATVNNGDMVKY
ncbi:MAG: hypothetical protein V7K68_01920 [Nostoc sp.]|uniref:hypothetical protein n=1 Tax=Nostoc sp. TaxID=1180 RepID=UPI002FF6917C